jgi:hypothetical protein
LEKRYGLFIFLQKWLLSILLDPWECEDGDIFLSLPCSGLEWAQGRSPLPPWSAMVVGVWQETEFWRGRRVCSGTWLYRSDNIDNKAAICWIFVLTPPPLWR